MQQTIRPGQPWFDTEGKRIHAHGGSIFSENGVFTWYGENKEHSTPGFGIWHWGMRAYQSTDLVNWEDKGLIIPPIPDDPMHPLHPSQGADRPHIIFNANTGKYVCWIKVMNRTEGHQESVVLTSDSLLGPYEIVHERLRPFGVDAGDFDLVVDSQTGKAYYCFEKVLTELYVAELTEDYTNVSGVFSSHFPHPGPPFTREAPAHFERDGLHYLLTSGTTGYFPNFTEVASGPDYHGPFTVLGNAHPGDDTRTSYRSQISSVFQHPGKKDLYIALADRWLPQLPEDLPNAYDSTAARLRGEPAPETDLPPERLQEIMALSAGEDTAHADYVWLPIRFDGEYPVIDWLAEWSPDDFADADETD